MTDTQWGSTDGASQRNDADGEDVYVVEDDNGERRVVREGPRRGGEEPRTGVTTADVVETATGPSIALLVSAPGQLYQGPIPSGATMTIWTGAFDDSGTAPSGVGSETLDVAVTRPDDTTENFSVTTNADGSTSVPYDLSQSNRGEGTYDVSVTDPDQEGTDASTQVEVGLSVIATSAWDNHLFTGKQATFSFLAHDGAAGASGVDLTLRVKHGGSTIEQTTETTDSDGFATVSFTPSQNGTYTIEAERNGTVQASSTVEAGDILARTDVQLVEGLAGSTSSYAGYLETSAGHLANTEFTVTFSKDSSQTDLLTEKTVTTDGGGFFAIDYDIPSDFTGSLHLSAETADGDPVVLIEDYLFVNERSSNGGGGGESTVELSVSTDWWNAPGETVSLNIEATDDGDPIPGQSVDVFARYGFEGPPAYSTTVTTGADGTVTTSMMLPENAPDGSEIDGTVAIQYNGDTYTDSIFANIQQYAIELDPPTVTPGTAETFTLDVTDLTTGDAAEGVPLQLDGVYGAGRAGSYGTAGMVSGSDGTDQASIDVPNDVGYEILAYHFSRYDGTNNTVVVPLDYDGTLSTSDTITAGESAEFSFDVPNDATIYGLAFATTPYPNRKTFATTFQGQGAFSLSIPSEFSTDDSLDVTVWAVDNQDNKYMDSVDTSVDESPLSVDASGDSNVAVGGEATISVLAQEVEQVTVEKLWTDWTATSQNADGGSVTDEIASAGTMTFDYSSIQGSASPWITLSLPDRYVGGEYVLEVTASNSNGESASTTATITIG